MEKWFIKNKRADFTLIANQFKISEVLARLIVNRGISSNGELEKYMNPSYANLHNPLLLKGMETASILLMKKIQEHKKIRIIGDYDVDGVISTYLLMTAMARCEANADYDIPDRMKDGYGLNKSMIEQAYNDGVDTIVTCDNGIAAIEQISFAKSLGMTVVITDHHDITYIEENSVKSYCLPQADAVINPKQPECNYPFKGLCGAAVAYKLIQVLYEKSGIESHAAEELLEFVALATVCDVMDLVDENRSIVKCGLEQMTNTKNLGLKALISVNALQEKQIGVYHLGFIIGPCINASGRLESAKIGLNMLLAQTEQEAHQLAEDLKSLNDERKILTNHGVNAAIDMLENSTLKEDKVIVVFLPECHESIAGIIAGRIKDRYHKPSIVLTKGAEGVKGSARSIEEYNMFEELNKCKDLLTKFGGHPMAAGLSLVEENIEHLREQLNKKTTLTQDDLAYKVSFDMVVPLERAGFPIIEELKVMEPYGRGNQRPLFAVKNIHVSKVLVLGQNKNVIRLTVEEALGGKQYAAIIFGDFKIFENNIREEYGEKELKNLYDGTDSKVLMDMVYYPDINEYKGFQNIQYVVQHYRAVNVE